MPSSYFKIKHAALRDEETNKIRLDYPIIKRLNIGIGEKVRLIGKQNVEAEVWPAYPEDVGKTDIVRVNSNTRRLLDLSIGDQVEIIGK